MVLSALLPLVEVTVTIYYEALPVADGMLYEVFPYVTDSTISYTALIVSVATILYALVVILITTFAIKSILRISWLKRFNTYRSIEAVRLYCCKQKIAPFSFFRNIFIPDTLPLDTSEGLRVLQHELEHVRAHHSADKAFAQALCTVFWFNPFFWFFKKEQSLVHEFLADRVYVKNGVAKELSGFILCSLYPMQHAYFGNQLFQSPIKRRLAMMTKNRTTHSSLRKLLILPVIAICLCVFAVTVESKPIPPCEVEIPADNPQPELIPIDEPQPDPAPTKR
jgi:hypothetical protein